MESLGERILRIAEQHPNKISYGSLGLALATSLFVHATVARAQEDPTGSRFEAGMLEMHPDSRTVREYVKGIGCLIGWDLDVPDDEIVSDGIVDRIYNPNGDQSRPDDNRPFVPYQYVPSIRITDFRVSNQMPLPLMDGIRTDPNHWWWTFESDREPDLHLPVNAWPFQQRLNGELPRVAEECEEPIS